MVHFVRALITGGGGFVGRWLAEHLRSEGDSVTVIDLEVDVTDPAAIGAATESAAPDAVYHLAALAHVGESWDAPTEVYRVNILGTANVLAAARSVAPGAAVLVVSSAEVYGTVPPDVLPLTEDRPTAPATPYAASKAAAEQVALQAHLGYGQRAIVARPFNHIGPGQSPAFAVSALSRRIVEAMTSGARAMPVGTLTTRRDFTDVRDVVRAYRLLVLHGQAGGVYNICSGADVAIGEVAHRLLELAGSDLVLETDPALVRPVDLPVLQGDPTRLETATGWKPAIDLDQTLTDVLADWRRRLSPGR
jgi:GDP-4-dehydro-6-deoxy-D-mannose reductase